MNMGTPGTLLEALINGILTCPANELPQNLERHAKDFISQGLTAAMIRYGDDPTAREALDYLSALWNMDRGPAAQMWRAIQSNDIRLLTELLRSHPDVA